jgi:hypothetical protein
VDSNAQRFLALINELTYLLRQYVANSEDAEDHPTEHFALINLLSSLEFLQRYANKEPKALALMKELHKRSEDLINETIKH